MANEREHAARDAGLGAAQILRGRREDAAATQKPSAEPAAEKPSAEPQKRSHVKGAIKGAAKGDVLGGVVGGIVGSKSGRRKSALGVSTSGNSGMKLLIAEFFICMVILGLSGLSGGSTQQAQPTGPAQNAPAPQGPGQ